MANQEGPGQLVLHILSGQGLLDREQFDCTLIDGVFGRESFGARCPCSS